MDNNVDTIIGLNVNLKGNLKNKGSIQINGTVEGEVRSDESVNVGETAKVIGPVIAKTIEVSGEIKGVVEATERLELNPTGKVIGDINAKNLIIKSGAVFIGKSNMPQENIVIEPEKESKKDDKEKEKEEDKTDKFGFFSKK